MIILVIGPSGVGKSDYGNHAANTIPGCRFFDPDTLVRERTGTPVAQLLPRIGNDEFFLLCRNEVSQLSTENVNDAALVAVGAGALQSSDARRWIAEHSRSSIAVMALPKEVYVRGGKRNESRTLHQFEQVEYSPERQKIYDAALHRCSVSGLSLEEARSCFADLVRSLLATQGIRNGA